MKEDFLNSRLASRERDGLLRKLSPESGLVDFCSNDYLSFSRSKELNGLLAVELSTLDFKPGTGSTGSRLLTGNTRYAEELEKYVADYHKAEAGLIFNSGYDANLGLISSIAKKADVIFYDELSHASIYDGVRLSKAESYPFRHNDVAHITERLEFFKTKNNGNSSCFVIVESVYSMDGDLAPLEELSVLCKRYNANLIVDEAHAAGIFGKNGEGRIVELGLQEKVFARVHTFGKALGCHGAIVLGSPDLRNYLINFARPFIYSTALPIHSLISIKCAYLLLSKSIDKILKINSLVNVFRSKLSINNLTGFLDSFSPIQSMLIGGNEMVKKVSEQVGKAGFDIRPILSPTVPKGKERIRICLHAFNTEEEMDRLFISLMKSVPAVSSKQAKVV